METAQATALPPIAARHARHVDRLYAGRTVMTPYPPNGIVTKGLIERVPRTRTYPVMDTAEHNGWVKLAGSATLRHRDVSPDGCYGTPTSTAGASPSSSPASPLRRRTGQDDPGTRQSGLTPGFGAAPHTTTDARQLALRPRLVGPVSAACRAAAYQPITPPPSDRARERGQSTQTCPHFGRTDGSNAARNARRL